MCRRRNRSLPISRSISRTNYKAAIPGLSNLILSTYYLTALVEELASGAFECSPIIPLQKPIIIQNEESFILSGPGHLLPKLAQKEAIELSFFASPSTLQQLAGPGSPSGVVVFNALFSILGTGAIPDRIVEEAAFRYEPGPHAHRRTGKLVITRTNGGTLRHCAIEWQLKGAHYCNATKTASAFLFLYIYDDDALSTWRLTDEIIANIAMPVPEIHCRRVVERGAGRGQHQGDYYSPPNPRGCPHAANHSRPWLLRRYVHRHSLRRCGLGLHHHLGSVRRS